MSQISEEVWMRVRAQANEQCGYCRSLQKHVLGVLEIEHIIPKAAGGSDDEENLWLACRLCNSYKGTQTRAKDPVTNRKVKLFNPRQQKWSHHFTWIYNGTHISGLTASGLATVLALQLNNLMLLRLDELGYPLAGTHQLKIIETFEGARRNLGRW